MAGRDTPERQGCCPSDWYLPCQAAIAEPERAYLLAKAHGMAEGTSFIRKCSTAADTHEEAQRKRLRAAPVYPRRRVELGDELPEVEVARPVGRKRGRESFGEGGGACEEEEEGEDSHMQEVLRAVVGHVMTQLKPDLVVELLQALRPKWSQTS